MSSFFALIDCNNFYVSCERAFDPSLNNIPVAILSNNDGCIVARSQEIKDLGIKIGTPYFKAEKVIKDHNGVVFSSNYELYGNMSERVIATLRTFSSDLEVYSIDEAFAGLPENIDYSEIAEKIVTTAKKWTGIPVKVGIAKTKTLCKMSAEIVKKRKISDSYYILTDSELVEKELNSFDVADIWGVGRKTADKLYKTGIRTAGQLSRYPEELIKKKYGINLLRTVMELKGTRCFTLETEPQHKKSMCFSRSFGKPVTDYFEMRESIVFYASSIAENLRKEKQLASAVTVYITTNYFKKEESQYSNSYTLPLNEQSNSTFDIVNTALKCLKLIYRKGYRYKKPGVILTDLVDDSISQGNLFSKQNIKNDKISSVMDEINKNIGKGSIKLAGEGLQNRQWKMKRGKLSKHYTSDWNELLEVN